MGSLFDLETDAGVLHGELGWLLEILEWASAFIDLFAIGLLLIGAGRFGVGIALAELHCNSDDRVGRMNRERIGLGRYILAGLELFIVSDVIHAALSLAFSDLVFLLLLVIIRSITSYFLDRELAQLKKELGR